MVTVKNPWNRGASGTLTPHTGASPLLEACSVAAPTRDSLILYPEVASNAWKVAHRVAAVDNQDSRPT